MAKYTLYINLYYDKIQLMGLKIPRIMSERLDFETHLKYTTRLAELSYGLSATCNIKPMLNKDKVKGIKNKLQLIKLTNKSINDEHEIVQFDSEYSTSSVSWLPIKTYYLIYHLLCIIDYILTNDPDSLSVSHIQCIRTFSNKLADQSIQFNKPLLNEVFNQSIFGFTSTSGEHLRTNVSDDVIYKLLMKKVANYKIKNFMITQSMPNLRQKKHRDKMNKFKNSLSVSIFDFFYLMRLRLNYRDFNFIDNIPASDTKTYFEEYYKAASYFYICFEKLKDKLIADITTSVETPLG